MRTAWCLAAGMTIQSVGSITLIMEISLSLSLSLDLPEGGNHYSLTKSFYNIGWVGF
jgi:hypothetical protein